MCFLPPRNLVNVFCLLTITAFTPHSLFGIDDGTDAQNVLVRVYERASRSKVGVLVSENVNQITIKDIKTGTNVSFTKKPNLKIINPLSLDDAARYAGLSTVVGWKLSQMAGKKKTVGKIARVTSQVVYVTIGKAGGLRVGQLLSVYRNDGNIVDPDSGLVVGAERSKIAQLEVVEVDSKLSKTKLKSDGDFEVKLEVGDEVEPASNGVVVAVCPIHDEDGWLTTVGASMAEDMTTNLVQRNVSVVERSVIGSALSELLVQKTALFDQKSSQKIGKLTGANLVLSGKIVPKRKKTGTAYVRLIQVETGDILFAISTSVNLSNAKRVNFASRSTSSPTSPTSSSDASLAKIRRVVNGSNWRVGRHRLALNKDGHTYGINKGGSWEISSPNSVKVYQASGQYLFIIVFDASLRTGTATWENGGSFPVKFLKK